MRQLRMRGQVDDVLVPVGATLEAPGQDAPGPLLGGAVVQGANLADRQLAGRRHVFGVRGRPNTRRLTYW
jgi:hypothetical protein